ncbi:MAG: hypothetical protein ACUVWV_09965 [Thermodesulfobacteriota bacterium]
MSSYFCADRLTFLVFFQRLVQAKDGATKLRLNWAWMSKVVASQINRP